MTDLLSELEAVVGLIDIRRTDGRLRYSYPPDDLASAAARFFANHRAEIAAAVRDAIPTSAWEALLPGTYYMDPPDGGDVSVYEQMRRMAKDAARYRWLRSRIAGRDHVAELVELNDEGGRLLSENDAAIDTAMRAGEGE
jgi:hypothetical protein